MAGRRSPMEPHDFYCPKCGKKSMTILRKIGSNREAFHRKKLYCPWCHYDGNQIEIRTFAEKIEFIENFEKGVYEDEVQESVDLSRNSRIW